MNVNDKTNLFPTSFCSKTHTFEDLTVATCATHSFSDHDHPLAMSQTIEISHSKEPSSLLKKLIPGSIHSMDLDAIIIDDGMNSIHDEESSGCPSCLGSDIKEEIDEIRCILESEAIVSDTSKKTVHQRKIMSQETHSDFPPMTLSHQLPFDVNEPLSELSARHLPKMTQTLNPSEVQESKCDMLPCQPLRRSSLSSGGHSSGGSEICSSDSRGFPSNVSRALICEDSNPGGQLLTVRDEENLEQSSSAILNDPSGIAIRETPPLSAKEIESLVMARIPSCVQEQLPSEEWKRIFSAAAECQKSLSSGSGRSDRTRDAEIQMNKSNKPLRVMLGDGSSSMVSGMTDSSLNGLDTRDKTVDNHSGIETLPLTPSPQQRLWDESLSTHEKAPQLPRRLSCPLTPPRHIPSTYVVPRFASDSLLAKPKRNVGFGTVQIRHYERILEVNPSTSSGPSVGLGWRYVQQLPIDLDSFQQSSTDPYELILPRHVREEMLRDIGYSGQDIAKAVRKSLRTKNQRKQTYNNLRHERVEYMVEKSRRKVGRLLRFRSGR